MPIAKCTRHPSRLNDRPAAQDCHYRPTPHFPSFPRTVIADVKIAASEFFTDGRINQAEVRVTAGRDYSFAGIKSQDARGVGRGYLGETLQRHPAPDHPLGENYAHPGFGTEVAAGDIINRAAAQLQLERGWVLIGRRGRNAIAHQPFPERLLVVGQLERWIGVITEAARL